MINRRLTRLMSGSRKYIYGQVIWKYAALVAQITFIYSMTQAFTQTLERDFDYLFLYVWLMLACIVVKDFATRRMTMMSHAASQNVKNILRQAIYGKLLRLGASYREHYESGELVMLMSEGVDSLETYYGLYLPQLIYSVSAPLVLFGLIAVFDLKISLVLLACVPLIPICIIIVNTIAKKILGKNLSQYASLGNRFLDYLSGLTTLKIYESDEQAARRMDEEAESFRKTTMRVLTMQLNSIIIMDLIAYGGAALGMYLAISHYFQHLITLPEALIVILLAADFFLPLRLLGSYFHVANNGMVNSDKIFAFLDLPEPERKTGKIDRAQHSVVFDHVSYAYDETPTLRDVSLRFPQGGFIGVVGVSGSGKSTVAKLLMKRCQTYQGSIRIGQSDLQDINEDDLFTHINYIGANSMLFKGTLRDNLSLGHAFSDDVYQVVLSRVNLASELSLDSVIEEGGRNLSGGQRQRIALARSILHDADIYIFDEATSHIDVDSEQLIMRMIMQMARFKTVIMMTHRLANVQFADHIYLLENGIVSEHGTHLELMQTQGTYYEMFTQQKALESYRGGDQHA